MPLDVSWSANHCISIPKPITDVLNSDKRVSVGEESSPSSTIGDFAYIKHYSHAIHEEDRLPSRLTNDEEQIRNGIPKQSKQSSRLLQELLMMTAENSRDAGEEILFL